MSLTMQQIVLATGNPGKVKELGQLLAPMQLEVLPQSQFDVPEVAETGTTFVENAIIKARHAAHITGLPAIADDSGLVVEALKGAPGIYSSRYAGDSATDRDNLEKLLAEMKDVEDGARGAHFQCVLVFMRHAEDPTPLICQGKWQGSITRAASGTSGFGYDPVFFVPSEGVTSANLTPSTKNSLSHRGQALQKLVAAMEAKSC